MEDNVILLTFESMDGNGRFAWFKNIKEVNEFVEKYGDNISTLIECVDTTGAKRIDLSELGN